MPFIQPNSASVQEKLCPRFGDSLCIDASGISFCERWAETVKDLYAHFVSGEKQAKEALHTAMVLRGKLSPSANVQDELQDRIGDAMAILSLPAQRLLKYKAFLEVSTIFCRIKVGGWLPILTCSDKELGRDEETESIKIASRAVEAVVTEIRTAKEARRLEDAKAELFAALDEPDQVLVRKCGELLRFEDAATTVIEGTTQENVRVSPPHSHRLASRLLLIVSWCCSH